VTSPEELRAGRVEEEPEAGDQQDRLACTVDLEVQPRPTVRVRHELVRCQEALDQRGDTLRLVEQEGMTAVPDDVQLRIR
jgi:hypothetical protein